MIEVVYHRAFTRLTVTGHAYSGEPGHDLVCAAATILTYTLARAVADMERSGAVRSSAADMGAGRAEISCRPQAKMASVAELVFRTICGGYDMLAEKYPDNIKFEIRG